MFIGALFVIAACFCWGLIFVIPKYCAAFSPIEVALGRYLFYGIMSLILLLATKRHLLRRELTATWIKAFCFSFISTLFSYSCVVFCIQYANSAVAALIFGMSPITIALYGNLRRREYSFKHFTIPLSLMGLGIVLANLNAFETGDVSLGIYCLGILGGFVGLASWTWYTIANFQYIEQHKNFSSNDWVTMIGAATFFLVLITGAIYACFMSDFSRYTVMSEDLQVFLWGSLIMGTVSTWAAFYFWYSGNMRLPITLAGQLTVFEMLFGIFFVYLAEQRWPYFLEVAGITIVLLGVLLGFRTLKRISVKRLVETQR